MSCRLGSVCSLCRQVRVRNMSQWLHGKNSTVHRDMSPGTYLLVFMAATPQLFTETWVRRHVSVSHGNNYTLHKDMRTGSCLRVFMAPTLLFAEIWVRTYVSVSSWQQLHSSQTHESGRHVSVSSYHQLYSPETHETGVLFPWLHGTNSTLRRDMSPEICLRDMNPEICLSDLMAPTQFFADTRDRGLVSVSSWLHP
jgi:hypothetical protein